MHALMGRVDTHFVLDDTEGKDWERKHVEEVLRANSYPDRFVQRIVRRRERRSENQRSEQMEERRNTCYVSIPYVRGMSEAIPNILRPLGLTVAHRSSPWKWALCEGIKDQIPDHLKRGVVYCVPCRECEAVYVGETMRNLAVRLQEHKRHSVNGDIHRSAVAEHVFKC